MSEEEKKYIGKIVYEWRNSTGPIGMVDKSLFQGFGRPPSTAEHNQALHCIVCQLRVGGVIK